MHNELIQHTAKLMQEQAAAYVRLDSACAHLATSLVQGAPETIESLTRAGENELFKMRSRLMQIMSALTAFTDARAKASAQTSISPETRAAFETASAELTTAARNFERTRRRATALARSGASLASSNIELCGFQPTTYRAPYARYGQKAWA